MVGLTAGQLGSSRLYSGGCGTLQRNRCSRSRARLLTADELLVKGPRGGSKSGQGQRHALIVANDGELRGTMARASSAPHRLHGSLAASKEKHADTTSASLRAEAEGRLGGVVTERVRQKYLETTMAHPRSRERGERLRCFQTHLDWAQSLSGQCPAGARAELQQFHDHARSQEHISQAHALRDEALRCVEDSDERRARPKMDQAALAVARRRIVGQAMGMLSDWRRDVKVAHALCDTLIAMVQAGGQDFSEEMERLGLGVLASTVADIHSDRPDAARAAVRVLALVSVELLVGLIEDSMKSCGVLVSLGLEVINATAKADPRIVDEVARYGGREMLDDVEAVWAGDQQISLHALSLRRRLRDCKVRSCRRRPEVKLPPAEIIRYRGCFESLDADSNDTIDAEELATAFHLLGMTPTKSEIDAALAEVDVDGSGRIEWPEFILLLSKFGANPSIESQFTQPRLAELREVFSLFDADGNGSLDAGELGAVFRSVGFCPTEGEIRGIIRQFDTNGAGSISWSEFLYLMSKQVADGEARYRLAFKLFDVRNEGRIPRASFIKQMKKLNSDFKTRELEEMILDCKFEDGDLQSITYKEFVKMLMRA